MNFLGWLGLVVTFVGTLVGVYAYCELKLEKAVQAPQKKSKRRIPLKSSNPSQKKRPYLKVLVVSLSIMLLTVPISLLLAYFFPPSSEGHASSNNPTPIISITTTSQNNNPSPVATSKSSVTAHSTNTAQPKQTPTSPQGTSQNPITPNQTPISTRPPTTVPGMAQPDPTAVTESLTVPFTLGYPPGVQTSHEFIGTVKVTVSGVGKASANQYSDAFYIYTDNSGKPLDPPYHPTTMTLCINGANADTFTTVPPYNSSHIYTFTFVAPRGTINFGVNDAYTVDNSGEYNVTITQEA